MNNASIDDTLESYTNQIYHLVEDEEESFTVSQAEIDNVFIIPTPKQVHNKRLTPIALL